MRLTPKSDSHITTIPITNTAPNKPTPPPQQPPQALQAPIPSYQPPRLIESVLVASQIQEINNRPSFQAKEQALRHTRTRGLPADSCAFLSALDILRGTNYLTRLKMDYSDNPALAHLLRRGPFYGCNIPFTNAIASTIDIARRDLHMELQQR